MDDHYEDVESERIVEDIHSAFGIFIGKLFTSIFGGNQFMTPSYYVYANDEGTTYAYALTALCLGISYSLILVVWLASVNRSQELAMQLHVLSGVQNTSSLEQNPTSH